MGSCLSRQKRACTSSIGSKSLPKVLGRKEGPSACGTGGWRPTSWPPGASVGRSAPLLPQVSCLCRPARQGCATTTSAAAASAAAARWPAAGVVALRLPSWLVPDFLDRHPHACTPRCCCSLRPLRQRIRPSAPPQPAEPASHCRHVRGARASPWSEGWPIRLACCCFGGRICSRWEHASG